MTKEIDRIARTAALLRESIGYGSDGVATVPDDPFGDDFQPLADAADGMVAGAVEQGGEGAAWQLPPEITDDEMLAAKLAPRCIVADYLFADVAALVAPGSTGKTTATLYEAICIVLGRPMWGLDVLAPGPVLIVTAEDRREFLVARIREIMHHMGLSADDRAAVMRGIRIDDRTTDIRRLTVIVCDVVMASTFASEIVAGCKSAKFAPALVQFDPLVSFGVGSARVNDSEQGLVEAGRIIATGLDCCARYIHHVSKISAREKALDQYAARGGTALPDGARMVAVMSGLTDDEYRNATGDNLTQGQSALVLARPKLSYAPPQPQHIYVLRTGYAFKRVQPAISRSESDAAQVVGDQLARYIESQFADGVRHTKNTLTELRPDGMTRTSVRSGMAYLEACGRIRCEETTLGRGGARYYLRATIA